MGLRINTNVQSLISQNRLQNNKERLDDTQQRLATGSRIVKPMDDAAGLAISENLRATIRATGQNIKNAQNGFFLLQTADGALNELFNITIRMKELATSAASDTNGDKERGYLDNEYQQLKAELDRISQTTKFNGRELLTGNGGVVDIQVGPENNEDLDRIRVSTDFAVSSDILGMDGLAIDSADGARESLDPLQVALDRISKIRAEIGAAESRLNTTIKSLGLYEENTTGAYSMIRDADMAYETAEYTKFNILTQAGTAVLAQANNAPTLALKLLGGV